MKVGFVLNFWQTPHTQRLWWPFNNNVAYDGEARTFVYFIDMPDFSAYYNILAIIIVKHTCICIHIKFYLSKRFGVLHFVFVNALLGGNRKNVC